jgi:hypothetical protein
MLINDIFKCSPQLKLLAAAAKLSSCDVRCLFLYTSGYVLNGAALEKNVTRFEKKFKRAPKASYIKFLNKFHKKYDT